MEGMDVQMGKANEKSKFESRFAENIIEVAAVTGASGISAGRAGGDMLWTASIHLIAWKNLSNSEPLRKEKVRLEWLVSDEEWEKSKGILQEDTVVKLQVRRAEKSMMLVKVLETAYEDAALDFILRDAMKPVFYHDEVLGEFELDRVVKFFEKEISWAGEEGTLYFDWDEDENIMKSALETASILFKEQDEWMTKIKVFAAKELVELANDWLQDDDENAVISKEMFKDYLEFDSMTVYPNGEFEIFFFDGDMFLGHSIIVDGNIDGNLTSADIAG